MLVSVARSTAKTGVELLKAIVNTEGFNRHLQAVKIISAGDGHCSCEMTVQDIHRNRHNTLHGGMTASLIDSITTWALQTQYPDRPGATVELSVSYLSSVNVGEEIVITGDTLKVGKTMAFLSGEIKNKASGKLVAVGKHTKYI